MIDQLVRYAERLKLPGPGFTPKRIKWALLCTTEGQLMGVEELADGSGKKKNPGREFAVCPETSGMEAGKKSHFLVETLETVLLMCKEEDRPKFEPKHAFFVKQLRDAASVCPEMGCFADLIDDQSARDKMVEQLTDRKAKPTDKITLMVHGRREPFLVDDPTWHDWWADYRKTLSKAPPKKKTARASAGKADGRMRCFVTGKMVDPAETHPKITGLADVGVSAKGAPLISFDKDALCSYGLKQSANAAMSEEAAAAYRAGLNHVVANHGRALAGAKVAYWFDKQVPDAHSEYDVPTFLLGTSEKMQERDALDSAKKLLGAIEKGEIPFAKNNRYYALTLSGNKGRVVVRDWMTGSFKELLASVIAWFDDLAIVNLSGVQTTRLPKLETVVTCLLPPRKRDQKYKDWVKPISTDREALWHAALDKTRPIPYAVMVKSLLLLTQFITNNKLEEARDNEGRGALEIARMYCRLGILKAFHTRNKKGDVPMKNELMHDHPKREYHCGRLMAVIAELQRVALAKVGEDGRWTSVNAGVVQRYYAAASATPSLVFGRLLRTAQYHLGKMDGTRDKGHYVGLFNAYLTAIQDRIGETSDDGIADFPRTLDFRQQSLFALGYYHQMAQMNADRANAVAKRKEKGNRDDTDA